MNALQVDHGIPLPIRVTKLTASSPVLARRHRYPWRLMRVGDSFFVAGYAMGTPIAGFNTFTTSAGKRAMPGTEWITELRAESGVMGTRVWRTKGLHENGSTCWGSSTASTRCQGCPWWSS